MAKRKTKTKAKSTSKKFLYTLALLLVLGLIIATVVMGYYLGKEKSQSEVAKKERLQKEQQKSQKEMPSEPKTINERLYEVLQKESKELNATLPITPEPPKALPILEQTQESQEPKKLPEPQEPEVKVDLKPKEEISASHEIDDTPAEKLQSHKREVVKSNKRAKLAIIIDDVATKRQVQAIKSLNLPLVLSFLPPSKGRSATPYLAANEEHYMVHLPMEAQKFSAEEPHTLRVGDSQEKILKRVQEIKRLFPKARYVNNHTGSKFTANEAAMKRLINALSQNDIAFIDSRTTGATKAPKVAKMFGLRYLGRDVFLDHHMDKPYILKQIKLAIKVAKRHGNAIAIGHPHKNTLQALRESKKLLADVDLVFIDRL